MQYIFELLKAWQFKHWGTSLRFCGGLTLIRTCKRSVRLWISVLVGLGSNSSRYNGSACKSGGKLPWDLFMVKFTIFIVKFTIICTKCFL